MDHHYHCKFVFIKILFIFYHLSFTGNPLAHFLGSTSNCWALVDLRLISNSSYLILLGTFGYVDHVRHPTDHSREYARKTIKYNEKMDANGDISATAIREISILKTLDHPNVIK